MNTPEFLMWIRDRLVHRYQESRDVDFVLRLTEIAQNYPVDGEAYKAAEKRAVKALESMVAAFGTKAQTAQQAEALTKAYTVIEGYLRATRPTGKTIGSTWPSPGVTIGEFLDHHKGRFVRIEYGCKYTDGLARCHNRFTEGSILGHGNRYVRISGIRPIPLDEIDLIEVILNNP